MHWETLSWKVGTISERECFCAMMPAAATEQFSLYGRAAGGRVKT